MKRRFFGILLTLVLLCCAVTVAALAADPVSGSYGGLTWTYQDGTLTISGTGESGYDMPWSSYKSEIRHLVLEDGVKGLGAKAMMDCTALESVSLSDSVRYFGDQCFSGCANLKSITLPEKFSGIGERAFMGAGLESIDIPGTVSAIKTYAFAGCTSLKSVTFHEGLTIIWERAFAGCTALESVECPDSLKYTQDYIFCGCSSLKYVKYPAGLTVVGNGMFSGCISLETVDMPVSVLPDHGAWVGESAFSGCKSLKSFDLSYMTEVKMYAFQGCSSLEEIAFSDKLEGLGSHAFANCSSLKSVQLGNGVKDIEWGAFMGCSALEEIELPPSLNMLKSKVFADCTSLKTVVVRPMLLIIETDSFGYGGTPAQKLDQEITFYGYRGTTAEKYASSNGYDFVQLNTEDDLPFGDVADSQYYAVPTLWAYQRGIVSGISADRFAPNASCTRAQVVAFLWRMAGRPEPKTQGMVFVDVSPDSYYYKAVLWANEKGIARGVSFDNFAPDRIITRQELITFLYRMVDIHSMGDNPFVDVKRDSYGYYPILWAVHEGIAYGIDSTHFAPNQQCTRAQVVSFLYRFCRATNYHMRTPSWTE